MFDLSPSPKFKAFVAATSIPLVGGKLFTYRAGSSANPANYQATYKDSAGTSNTNPIILDSNGECDLWLGDLSYKYVLQDSVGNTLWTIDNIVSGSGSIVAAINALFVSTFADLATTPAAIGQTVNLLCHTSGLMGGGDFRAVSSVGLTPDGGTISASATAGIYWKRVYDGFVVNVTWFGIIPDLLGSGVDTTALQQQIWDNPNIYGIYYPSGRYGATKLTKTNPNLGLVYGDNAAIIGKATSPTSCLFELKVGNGFHMRGIKLAGAKNTNYTCGMHWYTNSNIYYPGKATLDIEIGEFLLGLNIGMLPSQTQYYGPNDNQADGIAIDAPISENVVTIKIQDCPQGLRMCQPNGKVTFLDSYIEAVGSGWLPVIPTSSWKTVVLERFGEMSFVGGFIENISGQGGSLIEMNSGNIMIESCVMETVAKIRLRGDYFALRMSKILNLGYNSTVDPLFIMQSDSTGAVTIDNSWLAFPYENMRVGFASLAKGVSSVITESYAEAPNVDITLDAVELRDSRGRSGYAWEMISAGVKVRGNFRLTSFEAISIGVSKRLVDVKIDMAKPNSLLGLIDQSSVGITNYPVTIPSTTGGWTFTAPGGVYSYGGQAPSATLNVESLNNIAQTPSRILRMQANALVSLTASSPSFSAEPFSYIYVTGWIYIGAGGGSTIGIKLEHRTFADALVSTTNIHLGPTTALAAGWQPFSGWVQQISGAAKARILLYVENGVDAQWYDVSAYVDK